MNFPAGIKPGSTANVPAQGINPMSFQERPRCVAFFVAELKFADATTWKADLNDIQRMAETLGNEFRG